MREARQFFTLAIIFVAIVPVSARDCRCRRPERGDQTRWGGNEVIVEAPEKHFRRMAGVIKLGDSGPVAGVLVEVFDNPGYLLDQSRAGSPPKQTRLRACVTSEDGSFCFRDVRSGSYELRASLSAGVDVTHVYAVIDAQSGSNEPIEVRLHLGT